MESKAQVCCKVHVVCIPSPFQSHIKAMLKLAKLLHHKDGLPYQPDDTTQDMSALCESIRNHVLLDPFRNLLAKLINAPSSNTVSWVIISDGFLSFAITAAEEVALPIILFFTISACSLMGFKQFRTLKDESYLTKELDTVIEWIPGMKDIRIRDLPSFVRSTDPDDILFNLTMEATEKASKASAILIHTFDALESQVLDALSSMFSHVLAVGPLQLLLDQIHDQDDGGRSLNSVGYNLWKEETECLYWLESKEPNSVIYVNFGSITVMTKEQLIEVGMGLANSGHPFLWILRDDMVIGDLESEFVEEIIILSKQKGFIASWCPQEEVLNHPSTGGFLTHSGWNSTMESLCAGVPLICWPFAGDQPTNCRYTCNEWGFGLEITSGEDVKRDEVEMLVRELMGPGQKGKKLRNKALEWKKKAEEATAPDGSSSINLEKLVNRFFYQRL
ncbi:hypothetical protein Patl1_33262 [Pistacia atlantica]|uniref:Uncharacterized protein n=1 Tax=Pistacia atlantica TaxID=434234 RepID=A0ACC1APV0_9ROSI|nr:hypothetical protein Patl1_33262 [Pistacia atlantica]